MLYTPDVLGPLVSPLAWLNAQRANQDKTIVTSASSVASRNSHVDTLCVYIKLGMYLSVTRDSLIHPYPLAIVFVYILFDTTKSFDPSKIEVQILFNKPPTTLMPATEIGFASNFFPFHRNGYTKGYKSRLEGWAVRTLLKKMFGVRLWIPSRERSHSP